MIVNENLNTELKTELHGEVLGKWGLFYFTSVPPKTGSIITFTNFLSFVAISKFFFAIFPHPCSAFSLGKLCAVSAGSQAFSISCECQDFKPSFLIKSSKISFFFVFTKFHIIQFSRDTQGIEIHLINCLLTFPLIQDARATRGRIILGRDPLKYLCDVNGSDGRIKRLWR